MATLPPSSKLAWRDVLRNWAQRGAELAAWPLLAWRGETRQDEIYDAEYYKFIEFSSAWSRDAMADSIVRDLGPRNALDVGCGTGALMEALRSRAVRVTGLEYSEAALEFCRQRGLTVRKLNLGRQRLPRDLRGCDLVLSFEVAEHLPRRWANRFVDLLSEASDVVVFSAATPGQGGTDHVNEQPHEYWIAKMAQRGFYFDQALTQQWRAEWRDCTANWYHANVMVFRQGRTLAKSA